MKRIVLAIVLGTVVIVQGKVQPYAGLGGGFSLMENATVNVNGSKAGEFDVDAGPNIEGAFGFDFLGSIPARTELSVAYQENELRSLKPSDGSSRIPTDGNISIGTVMANLYLDILDYGSDHASNVAHNPLYPYLFAGAGIACAWIDDGTDSKYDTLPAGNIGAGIGYFVTERLIADFKYKYLVTGRFEGMFGNKKVDVNMSSHQFQFGLRYLF
jgi:opacity protein-like surface antigen